MSNKFGLSLIALAAALITNFSSATAQTRSGGNWGGQTYNNPTQPTNAFNGNQPQQEYPSNAYQQQQGYSNGYQGQQAPPRYGPYSYPRGNSYAAPGYGSYRPRYYGGYERRAWREHRWRERMRRERMWREHNRYHGPRGW